MPKLGEGEGMRKAPFCRGHMSLGLGLLPRNKRHDVTPKS